MELIFLKHKDVIESFLSAEDLSIVLVDPLKKDFDESSLLRIMENKENKVDYFLREFMENKSKLKYLNLIETSYDISEWISHFLITKDDGKKARKRYDVSKHMINQNAEFFLDNLKFNDNLISYCVKDKLISERMGEALRNILALDGELFAKHMFQSILHIRSTDCYSKFLFMCWKFNQIYLEIFHTNLYTLLDQCICEEEAQDCIRLISSSDIEDCMLDFNDDMALSSLVLEGVVSESSFSEKNCFPDESDKDSTEGDDIVDPDFDNIFGECKNKISIDLLNFQSEPKSDGGASLEMRTYQNELAKTGVEGRNVLICAPTSSGKTVVAIKIIDEHLKLKAGGKAALVVPTTVLVDQQYNLFQKYLGKNWKINKLSGGSKSFSAPLSTQIKDYDIFVFTCDILRNSLEDVDESLGSIGEFTLVIFDECHHCDKDHSYNKVMDHYFKDKVMDMVIPQIIGMTASTGTDKAKTVDAALKSLFSLCANLDCYTVSSVKTNIEELNRNVPMPSNEIKSPGERCRDLFECSLVVLMEFTENIVIDIFSKKKPLSVPVDKYHDKYLTFIKSITNYVPNMLEEEERKAVKITEIYLEGFFRALIVNHLFNSNHAINMLKGKISMQTPFTCDVEKILRQKFKEFLSSISLDQDSNPCLDCLKEEIVKQIKEDKKSKIIVFVKEVLYTKILENEIQAAKLGFIQCKALVGTNKGLEQGGISKSVTEDIVNKFRQGIINLIFATSVAEEGLDIEKCNLVVRYGHVTNEISMVQSRGRARASHSKYIVIVPQKLRWQINKENVNKARESMMYRAIGMFQDMEVKDLKLELLKFQEKRLALRSDGATINDLFPVPKVCDASDWSLHCNKCEKYICRSEDIRVANGTSYVIINKEAYPHVKMQKAKLNNCPLVCSGCENNLGYVIKVHGINVPTINIRQTILKRGDENKKYKKWKDAPFNIPQSTGHDISNCHSEMFDN